jgi:hypothetical protein
VVEDLSFIVLISIILKEYSSEVLCSHSSELTMIMAEISETLVFNSTLTRLIAQDFSTFTCYESLKSCIVNIIITFFWDVMSCINISEETFCLHSHIYSCSSKTLITTYETTQCHNAAYHNHNHHSSCSQIANLYQKRQVNYEQCHLASLTTCSSKGAWHFGETYHPHLRVEELSWLPPSCLPYSSILKMEITYSSETLGCLWITRHYKPEDHTLHSHHCWNLKVNFHQYESEIFSRWYLEHCSTHSTATVNFHFKLILLHAYIYLIHSFLFWHICFKATVTMGQEAALSQCMFLCLSWGTI